jgi:hypothetical protein
VFGHRNTHYSGYSGEYSGGYSSGCCPIYCHLNSSKTKIHPERLFGFVASIDDVWSSGVSEFILDKSATALQICLKFFKGKWKI